LLGRILRLSFPCQPATSYIQISPREVRHRRPTVVQQDVLGLDVAVDHAPMRVVERIGHIGRDADGLADPELRLAVELAVYRRVRRRASARGAGPAWRGLFRRNGVPRFSRG
jgi:hypothetical protein